MRRQQAHPGPRHAGHLVQLGPVALQHPGLAQRGQRRPEVFLPHQHPRHRLRYHRLLGQPHDLLRSCLHRQGTLQHRVHPRHRPRQPGPQDVQEPGQRHRPAGSHCPVRCRRPALHAGGWFHPRQRHALYRKEGENLLYSKSGEPVILTQIGKDGEYVGVLNAVFNKDGILTKVQNNVMRTGSFTRKLPFKTAVESIIGKPEVLGNIKSAPPSPKDRLIANNPHGNIIVDAMRNELGTDIAILNAGNLRGFFAEGEVDSRRINDVTPFEDKMMICNLSEKQIVAALKVGAKSFLNPGHKPGILLVSGLQYSVSDKGQLLDLAFIDKQGNKVPIDINNPSDSKKFTVACDDFFAYGGDNYLPVNSNPDYVVKKFDVDKNVYTANYIKKQSQPIEIKEDDRIKIVKS